MNNACRILMILCFAAYGNSCEQAETKFPLDTKDVLSADGKGAKANTESKNNPEENPQKTFTEEAADEDVESAVAIEPVPVGGAFLVCVEQQKGGNSTALCRLEDEMEQRMEPPQSWQLTYYVQTAKAKVSLASQNIPMDDPIGFSWQVTLGKYRLANVMVEIYDSEKGTVDITAPILMDSTTMRPPSGKDPRGKKPR